jgi:hypothetical protein
MKFTTVIVITLVIVVTNLTIIDVVPLLDRRASLPIENQVGNFTSLKKFYGKQFGTHRNFKP